MTRSTRPDIGGHGHSSRLLAALAVLVTSCGGGESRLDAEQVTTRLRSACADHRTRRDGGIHATAGETFTSDTLDEFGIYDSETLPMIEELHGPDAQREQLDRLHGSITQLADAYSNARTNLEVRNWAEAQVQIDAGLSTVEVVDAAALEVGLPECGADTWVGGWFAEAQRHLDGEFEATRPTGDFVTDVEAACSRLTEDISDAPLPLTAVDAQVWMLSLRDALDLFIRDVEALDVPDEERDEVAELSTVVDELQSDLGRLSSSAADPNDDAGALIASAQEGIGEVVALVADLGATC